MSENKNFEIECIYELSSKLYGNRKMIYCDDLITANDIVDKSVKKLTDEKKTTILTIRSKNSADEWKLLRAVRT
jgi:hypothetical protein